VEQENYCVYAARASQAPGLVQELGRLRELTFRAVGEGTGRARDIDLFDSYYLHLFVWDRADQRVVGAYRLGLSDELIKKYGVKALYTHSLFNYGKRLLAELPPAIELGRSFVVREYQRDFAPLLLLWRGIGAFVANNPKYRVLFGPVSISAEFKPVTRQLLVTYLRQHRFDRALARRVRPRQPFRGQGMRMRDFRPLLRSDDLDSIADVILQLEDERQDVPILLKHHLKLGGKALGFNVDGQFSDALDGLIMVDLNVADRRTLQRYMGAGACSVSSSTRRHNGNVLLPESIG
jgi:putative hemolysin